MKRFTTTIGKIIYVPFRIGVADDIFSLLDQLYICVHEHQHVEQADRQGFFKFSGRYIFSSAKRASYEAEAYRSDMELHFWRTGELLDPKILAARLTYYACTSSDVKVAEKMLAMSAATVMRGGVVNRSSQIAIRWLNRHIPHLAYKKETNAT